MGPVDEKTQVSVILESLTPTFLPFTTNYIMNKLEYNLTQLLNELQTFETISKTRSKEGEANVAQRRPSSSVGRTNKNKKKKSTGGSGAQPKQRAPKSGEKKKNSSKVKEPKGKCFHCGAEGHWKRNCRKYLSEVKNKKQGKYDLLVLEACLVESDTNAWIVDSGATNHICSSLQTLSSSTPLRDGDVSMRLGSGEVVSATAVGVARLEFGNSFLIL